MPWRPDLLATPAGRRCLFALLYFAEGAPIGYVWWALPTRLRAAGVSIEDITQLSALLTLPWAFKFMWAPLVDALRPRVGGLRVWITSAQIAMGATLLPIAGIDPVEHYDFLLMMLLAHAVSAATQDVAIDALAISSTPAGERGSMTGWMQIGMLGGRATFGGLALQAEAWIGATAVVYGLVGLVWTSSLLVWLAREEPSPIAMDLAQRMNRFVESLSSVLSHRTTWLGLGLAVVAGAGMEATGSIAGPMLIDRGLEKSSVGFFFALPAVVCMGLGALVGGHLSDGRRDRARTLAFAVIGLACSVSLLAAVVSRALAPPAWGIVATLAFVYAFFGVYTASAYALFMEITDPSLGGTQFSAYMGGINLCSVWSGWVVGRLAGAFDYSAALVAMAAASLLALPLLLLVRRAPAQQDIPRSGSPD